MLKAPWCPKLKIILKSKAVRTHKTRSVLNVLSDLKSKYASWAMDGAALTYEVFPFSMPFFLLRASQWNSLFTLGNMKYSISFKNTLFYYEKTYYLTSELCNIWVLKMGQWLLKACGSSEPVLWIRTYVTFVMVTYVKTLVSSKASLLFHFLIEEDFKHVK